MSGNVELDGLKSLRTGNLLLILAPILITIGEISGGLGLFGLLSGFSGYGSPMAASFGTGGAVFGIILAIVGYLLGLGAVYMFMKGFGQLSQVDPEFKIGRTGVSVFLAALVVSFLAEIVMLVGILTGSVLLFAGPILAVIGVFFFIIGIILTAIGFYRVGSKYNEGLVKVGGILLILGPLAFIGAILNYVGLGSIIRKKLGQ